MQKTPRRLASWVYAALFCSVATYHFFVLLDSEMPHAMVLRHLVFCIVDAAFMVLVWLWPRWLLIPVGLLTLEQFHAHAGHVWHLWHNQREISWLGVISLAGLTILCLLLVRDEFKQLRS